MILSTRAEINYWVMAGLLRLHMLRERLPPKKGRLSRVASSIASRYAESFDRQCILFDGGPRSCKGFNARRIR